MKTYRVLTLALLIPVLGFWSLISARAESTAAPSMIQDVTSTPAPTQDAIVPGSRTVIPNVLGQITVTGKVSHGGGGEIPLSLMVYLEEWDTTNGNLIWSKTMLTNPDGTFLFEDVDLLENCALVASVDYQQNVFGSENFLVSELTAGSTLDIPLTIYESTTDGSALVISQLHFIFEETSPGVIQVVEWLQITNPTNMVVVGDGVNPVVRYAIPPDIDLATLQFPDGADTRTLNSIANGIGDWQSIQPGSGYQLMFAYNLPDQPSYELIIPFDQPITQIVMMAPVGLMEVKSNQLTAGGQRTIQGASVELYTGGNLPANSELRATVSRITTPTNWLAIGGFALAGVLLLAALALFIRQRRMTGEEASSHARHGRSSRSEREKLLDMIVALDDKFHAGELDEETYRSARGELKDRLANLKGS